jgi:hypothetical protein
MGNTDIERRQAFGSATHDLHRVVNINLSNPYPIVYVY